MVVTRSPLCEHVAGLFVCLLSASSGWFPQTQTSVHSARFDIVPSAVSQLARKNKKKNIKKKEDVKLKTDYFGCGVRGGVSKTHGSQACDQHGRHDLRKSGVYKQVHRGGTHMCVLVHLIVV